MQDQAAAHLTVCSVWKWFNVLISVCLGLWVSNRRLSVRASFWGRLLTGWRCVCLSISFLKWDMKFNGCCFRVSTLLWVSNAKAPCRKIVYPNQHQLGSSLCSKTPCTVFLFWCSPFLLLTDSLSCFSNWSCCKSPLPCFPLLLDFVA